MIFKHFRLQLFARVLLVGLTMALLIYLVMQRSLYATPVLVAALLVYQMWALMRFVDRTNDQLTRFFEAIRHADFSQSFASLGLGRSFDGLSQAFSEVAEEFRRARSEKEEQYRYLQTLVQHIGVGVLAFNQAGDVVLINQAAKRLLNVPHLRTLDRLAQQDPLLSATFRELQPGQRRLIKLTVDYDTLQLAVNAAKIRRADDTLTLVSIQNIGSELAEQEMVAWQNLIRVLTHEIMNSVTPIASLAGSVNDLVRPCAAAPPDRPAPVSPEMMTDLSDALTTIEKRSQGLLHFVEAYRNLTRIPRPEFRIVRAEELLARVHQLLHAQACTQGTALRYEVSPRDLELAVDPDLVEQVLINLVLNALQSLQDAPGGAVEIIARPGRSGRTLIEVIDTGPGIVESALDKIFIPFFTTKKGGSGIGLALARQIMRLHNGNITVRSIPDERTCFTLSF